MPTGPDISYRIVPIENDRKYLFSFRERATGGKPIPVTLRVACSARCYSAEFVKERTVTPEPAG